MKKILHQGKIWSNYSNKINVNEEFIKDSVYFYSENLIGIPVYISINNGHISMEHTHPPASFVIHGDRFKVQGEIKRRWFNILKNFDEK